MIGKKISHYRVLGKIGEGDMGQVYLVQDEKAMLEPRYLLEIARLLDQKETAGMEYQRVLALWSRADSGFPLAER